MKCRNCKNLSWCDAISDSPDIDRGRERTMEMEIFLRKGEGDNEI